MKYSISVWKRCVSWHTSLKLSNADRIISWPPLTRQIAASNSKTNAFVLQTIKPYINLIFTVNITFSKTINFNYLKTIGTMHISYQNFGETALYSSQSIIRMMKLRMLNGTCIGYWWESQRERGHRKTKTEVSCPFWIKWPDATFIWVAITFFIFHVGHPLWWEDGSVICSAMTQVQFHVTLRLIVCRPVGLGANQILICLFNSYCAYDLDKHQTVYNTYGKNKRICEQICIQIYIYLYLWFFDYH
jgi:hypothetical protein